MKEYIVRVYDNRTEWRNEKFLFHREDGPAIEYADGRKYWYKDGEYHRENGPAIEYSDGDKCWYLLGKEYTEKQYNAKMNPVLTCTGKFVEIDGKKYKLVEI